MSEKTGNILCFGEVLWDCLEAGLFPGGAPMNLAYHLAQLGWTTWPVSGVGRDFLGEELLARLQSHGIQTGLICVNDDLPTGVVRVRLKSGIPAYEIVENVAWDRIELPETLPGASIPVRAIVFGSLAMRTASNRTALLRLFDLFPDAFKVFDVNLRPPFVDRGLILELAARADLVKVNDGELAELLGADSSQGDYASKARILAATTGCSRLCLTAGAEGAGLLENGAWHWVDAQSIDVVDTIGAGDAFLSGLLHGLLLDEHKREEILAAASRLAGFVASRAGATPVHPDNLFS